jgi:hypothetical protein
MNRTVDKDFNNIAKVEKFRNGAYWNFSIYLSFCQNRNKILI